MMKKPARRLLAAALALATAPAFAGPFTQTVFFGDSLTDSGFYRPFLVQNAGPSAATVGRFTTNPGLVWAEYLANYYGTNAAPAWGLTNTGIVADTGSNYAAGGATVKPGPGFPPSVPTQFAPSLGTQVTAYLARNGGRADPNALYTVWGGANDLFFALNGAITTQQFLGSAQTQVGLVNTLTVAGARYILVPTMPDVGLTPFGLSQGAAGSAGITALVNGYNQTLFGGLAQQNLRVIPLDTFHLLREISAAPATYGFNSATIPACAGTSLTCVSVGSGRAFADGVHPSSEAHAILAQYAVSVLEAPGQVALLPNSASMVGRSRAERVAAHASAPQADGMKWWSDVRGDFQRYGDGDVYDGAGPTLTFGVDWNSGNFVYGAFAGYGRQGMDFGQRKGSFDQTDLTLGGFAGWYGEGGGWVNAQLSWSQVDFDVDREVVLGPAVRKHSGSADGENLTGGVSAGWEFGEGALRHGPVLSVLAQRIDVDGYAEDGADLSTALAYPDQSFDSLIGSVGWQASYVINDHLQPYARLTADREFEDAPEEAFAQLQSMPGTAPYAVPGVQFDQDYSTLTFGARTKLFGLDANIGTSVTAGQKGANHATLFATIGSNF
ncbi:autotransporter domain-containing protein [Lysobacter solisilvae (ex Woo and Kim 2020)]|uniref:Autotransporter domain-containing protein n=1 Tax=Agrilutibacter terrestris TaxID=2865112 RepID=A0A7H0FUU2_9GAMM|nr:autotransporter domain-containing protein [Lysobacter terrestris]QNP39808.1 autotransporter domain-containing protein [Lysobacter terrestris]